jgi:hypothetical protein
MESVRVILTSLDYPNQFQETFQHSREIYSAPFFHIIMLPDIMILVSRFLVNYEYVLGTGICS